MSLQLPVLDDTDFEQLLQMGLAQIDDKLGVEWKAASESDPGRVLIEVFAYMTDQMIYRVFLNTTPNFNNDACLIIYSLIILPGGAFTVSYFLQTGPVRTTDF